MWVDLYCPGVPKAGGFSITSTPRDARPGSRTARSRGPGPGEGSDGLATTDSPSRPGYFELAVQKSPDNPHAAWLWQRRDLLLGQRVGVRVGGSFVWPPPGVSDPDARLRRVVFVASGVGVNPLVSMLSALAGDGRGAAWDVQFLYSLKDPGPGRRDPARMLFLPRLASLFGSGRLRGRLQLFLTGAEPTPDADDDESLACGEARVPVVRRRMTVQDVEAAVGDRAAACDAAVYICGVPAMTDSFVKALQAPDGLAMEPSRVLCEKWW